MGLFFFLFFFFLKISSEWTHEGKRLFGRCVQWWFHLRFQWRPFCLWPARSFKTEQEHDNSTDSILQPWNSQLLRSCQLPFCYVYISWWILKKKKKSASIQEGEFILILLLLLAKFSFETQGFFNVASCFQTVIWCVLYAHNLPSSCFHWDWLCVCVFGVREGGFFWGGKWSGLCVHRGIQSCPQSHRGSTTIPPRVLNYYHIYTFMWPLLCKICKICSVFLLLTKHLAVIFLKNTVESIVWRITPCTVHALHFSTAV